MGRKLETQLDQAALQVAVEKANRDGVASFRLNEEHAFQIQGPTTFEYQLRRIAGFASQYPDAGVRPVVFGGDNALKDIDWK